MFRTLLKGTKRATSFSFIKSFPSAAAQILCCSCSPCWSPAEGTPSYKPQESWCQHFHYELLCSSIKNKALPTLSIFQIPLAPTKANKKVVQCLSQILGLDIHLCDAPCLSPQSSFPHWKLGWTNVHSQMRSPDAAALQHQDVQQRPAIRVNWCWRATPHRESWTRNQNL